ncbi:MAG: hypothetical protein AAF492_05085, partial [Verrucomicrobiota bacterium]
LQSTFGLGSSDVFFNRRPENDTEAVQMIDRMLATQVAYGCMGRLADRAWSDELAVRSYYMMRELQQLYAMKTPLRTAWWNGEHFVPVSEAIGDGSVTAGRMYLSYPDELEIWVNGSHDRDWTVKQGEHTWHLPPAGWLAVGSSMFELSATVDGARLDVVETPSFIYYDGRGRRKPFRGVASSGPISFRLIEDGEAKRIEILDLSRSGDFAFGALFGIKQRPLACHRVNAQRERGEEIPLTDENGFVRIQTDSTSGSRYIVAFPPGA